MQDFRDAVRALRATPLVSAVAILSLALGIGANTAMFSIVDSLVLRTLPVPAAERLALLGGRMSWTNPIWEEIRARPALFDGAFAWSSARFNLAESGETDYVDGLWASGGFFDGLGVRPFLGRTFTASDDRRGGGPDGAVAVISHAYWQKRYGGDPRVIGRPITLSRVVFTIIGVTPPGFFGPEVGRTFDVAVPLGDEPLVRGKESALDRRSTWWLNIMIRRKPGQSIEAATAALHAVQPQVREATMPEHYRPQDRERYLTDRSSFALTPAATGSSYLRARYQTPLFTLMGVVALVLLIACGNIANLQLARATARHHELSVRQALGASRMRLARQLLAESMLLGLLGGVLGALVAVWGSRLLVRQLSTQVSEVHLQMPLDWRVLGFTAAAAIGTALLFGTAPALRAARAHPMDAIKEHGRDTSGAGRVTMAGTLVVAQVALSLVLLVGAGLFVRTFGALTTLELGFEREGVLIASVGAQRTGADSSQLAALYERARQAALALPGVRAAAVSAVTPVSGSTWNNSVRVVGGKDLSEEQSEAYENLITPDWFATYGTALLAGRDLAERDAAGGPKVAVVNQTFARHFLDGANPVGRIIEMGFAAPGRTPDRYEIVGLVADAVYRSLRDTIPPTMYVPVAQVAKPPTAMSLSVRMAGPPAALSHSLTRALTDVDRNLTVTYRTLADQVDASLNQERLVAVLSAFFGALALLLAGVGLYGVTAYSVSRRRTELGIRMALGTSPSGAIRLVMGRVARQVVIGIAIGALVSWWAARFISSLLFGLAPRDPLTMGAAAAVLVSVGALAGWLPARRASRIDPATVLREG